MMMTVRCIGAYGRKYHKAEDAKRDWDEGKDFRVVAADQWFGGPYFSKSDQDDMSAVLVKLEIPGIWYQLK